jgi:hypothetical protein
VAVLGDSAVVGDRPYQVGEFLVVGEHRARVAVGAEVLAGVEAGGRDAAAARRPAVAGRALALRGVLDDPYVGPAVGLQPVTVGQLAVQVHRHHRAGGRADRGQRGLRVEEIRVGQAVREDRSGADPGHRARRWR